MLKGGPDRTTVPRTCSTVLPLQHILKTEPQSPEQVLQLYPLQHILKTGPQSPEHVLPPSSTCWRLPTTDRTTVQRACSTVTPPLAYAEDRTTVPRPQSLEHVLQFCPLQHVLKTGPQSPEQVLQFCPLQHILKTGLDRTAVPRTCSTVLHPLQKSNNAAVAPWSHAARTRTSDLSITSPAL